MDQDFLTEFKKFGNPYKVLEIEEETLSDKVIKKAYTNLSRTHHPDKGGDKEKFLLIKKAYDLLKDPGFKEKLDNHLENLKQQKQQYLEKDAEIRSYGDALLREEELYQEKLKEKERKKMEEEIKKQEYIKNLQKENEEFKSRKQKQKQEETKLQSQQQDIWAKLSQVKIKWSKKQNVGYSANLLKQIFNEFGVIKEVQVFKQKNCAILEYLSVEAADKAVKAYKNKNNSDNENSQSDSDGDQQQELKVKFILKKKKRKNLLEQLQKEKKNLNEKHYGSKEEKLNGLDSNNLDKIQQVINRTSKYYVSNEQAEREKQRKKYMESFLKDD